WRTTFQVILEPGGNIVFQYLERTAPFSGTIGIENADATDGLEVSHNEFPPYVHDSLAVRIDAPTPWIPSVTPASGIIAAGGSAEVTIAVDADTLEQGEYLASLRIASNDPDRPWARVPVLLEVSGTLRLSLVAGWNLVSWNVEPENMAVEAVLAGILDRVQAVETYEGGERRWYVPGQTGNTLATLMPTYGYWIKLSDNALLEIEGTPVDRQLPLSLTGGLNAVSYLPWHSNGVGNALETIMAVTTTAASFEGTGITYATDVPAAFHVLDRMEPEAGYVIRTTAPGTLVYPAPSGGQSTGGEGQPTLEGRLLAEAEAGVTPTMAWLDVWGANVRLDGAPLPLGTRVVALDGQNRPVGAFDVVAEGNLGLMALYADDPYTAEKDGALPGETITLRVGAAVLAQLPWSMAGDVVDLSGTVVSTEDGGVLPTEYALERNYPNPFNPSTTIRYALPEAARVRLTVYDGLGRLVATLVDADLPAGRHQAVWDASSVASGVYLYRLQAGAFERSYQMLLLK
ncbi:MAG TPA: T9SS type A sorting domain-containing protein, partial [Rubricoccaceae bacterium]|nr:T9SS type A sorting domain-containing protein [Rubricoccaceae bacterium]